MSKSSEIANRSWELWSDYYKDGDLSNTEILHELENLIDSEIEKIKNEYEEKLRWIPIEEKLPENDIRVLTKFKNGKVIVNSYDTHMDKWQYEFDVEYTHWRSIL